MIKNRNGERSGADFGLFSFLGWRSATGGGFHSDFQDPVISFENGEPKTDNWQLLGNGARAPLTTFSAAS
jgi:hypothetical protein